MNKRSDKKPLITAILLSVLLVHLPLAFFLWRFAGKSPKPLREAKQNAVVVDLRQMRMLPTADLDKPAHEAVPEKASVQSVYNIKTREETVAANSRKTPGVPYPQPKRASPPQKQTAKAPQKNVPKSSPITKAKELRQPTLDSELAQTAKIPVVLPAKTESFQDRLKSLQDNQKNKESVGFKRFASNTNEMPMPRTNFGSGGGDYFPDIKVGSRTYVNALANPQVSYYAELKKKFRLAWDPVPALRSQINQISRGQITVVMGLSVDGSGRIAALTILKGSGLSAYDAEARRAIMASSPFSKPPAYIMQKDGQAHMAWTFVVYL